MEISNWEMGIRLLLACILGGMVGIEREHIHRPAGLRTHILVCVGSAIFTLVSAYGFSGFQVTDPSRIAAQIVSGIGFLGAGTIMRYRAGIRGLTTAASLWAVAGIGLACGIGYYLGAILTAVVVLASLMFLRPLELVLGKAQRLRYLILKVHDTEAATRAKSLLSQNGCEIKDLEMSTEGDELKLRLLLRIPLRLDYDLLLQEFPKIGVVRFEWEES